MKKISFIFFLLIGYAAFSQKNFNAEDLLKPRTGEQTLVNDFAGILTEDQRQTLEDKLVQFDDSTSIQIAVVIIPNLGKYDIADYNVELFRAWGVGSKDINNGVVLLISKEDKKLNITVGYGLEGALPDITCKQIIDEVIIPYFKGNDYYAGINNGTIAIMKAVKGEYIALKENNKEGGARLPPVIFWIICILILFIFMLPFIYATRSLIISIKGIRKKGFRSVMTSWISSNSSSSGGSSRSFGGFRGGSTGGGGASGSW